MSTLSSMADDLVWDELGPEFLFNIVADDANVSVRI